MFLLSTFLFFTSPPSPSFFGLIIFVFPPFSSALRFCSSSSSSFSFLHILFTSPSGGKKRKKEKEGTFSYFGRGCEYLYLLLLDESFPSPFFFRALAGPPVLNKKGSRAAGAPSPHMGAPRGDCLYSEEETIRRSRLYFDCTLFFPLFSLYFLFFASPSGGNRRSLLFNFFFGRFVPLPC